MAELSAPQRKPGVIFVNRFYWPDEPATAQLLTDLAESLAARGHEVTVIARRPGGDAPREETRHGVKILRVGSARRPRGGLVSKALEFASFFYRAVHQLNRVAQAGDALIALTDPPLLGVGVSWVARRKRARLFHWVQDIYPELAIELAGQGWLRATRPLRDAAWRSAEHCVTLGRDMASVLRAAKVPEEKITVVPNWAPLGQGRSALSEPNPLRSEWSLMGKFVVAYAGNLGRVHDLLPVLAVAEALRENPAIAFVFIGDGAQRVALEAKAARLKLSNVQFRPPQPRARLGETLALGDVHLVTLRAGCERLVFPSKLYGITAAGRPIIFLGPRGCEVAQTVTAGGFGLVFESAETTAIAAAIGRLEKNPAQCTDFGRAAAKFNDDAGGAAAATGQWSRLLAPARELVAPQPSR
jgi:colanic acid biosynthesis glycosyl transferase WcaI